MSIRLMRGAVRCLFAGASAAIGLVPPASAQGLTLQEVAWCMNERGPYAPDRRINGCTASIRSGHWRGADLAWAYYNRGNAWRAKGDLDRAIADYNEAIRLGPTNPSRYKNRGIAWREKGELDRAIADYDEAIRLDPNLANAYNSRGNVWRAKGDLTRAIADYDEAIRLEPTYAFAYNGRGNAWFSKGDFDRALADYSAAIRFDPNYANARNGRGNAWYAKGDGERAIADYGEAIRLDPKLALAYGNRALAHLYSGALTKALADVGQASKVNPKNVHYAVWHDIIGQRIGVPSRLSEAAASIDMTKWPAPVLRLFLGELTPVDVLAAADDSDPVKRRSQVCQANFYGGMMELRRGANDSAVRYFRQAASDCPRGFIELFAVNGELRRLGQ